jgi:hypothetical protein
MPRLRSGRNVGLPLAWTTREEARMIKRYTIPHEIALRMWHHYTRSAVAYAAPNHLVAMMFAARLQQAREENHGRVLISAATAELLLRDLDSRGGAGARRRTFEAALVATVYDTWNFRKTCFNSDFVCYFGAMGGYFYLHDSRCVVQLRAAAAAHAKKREDAAGYIREHINLD